MNYKLDITYKGTNYHGFAKQIDQVTIEQTILDCLKDLFNLDVKLFASGRTDRYVHAVRQVINIKHKDLNIPPEALLHALNAKLPSDIRALTCVIVDDNFHARFSAKSKTYIYLMNLGFQFNVFEQDIIYQYNQGVDLSKLDEFINIVQGKHDFLSFSTSELDNTIRTIKKIEYSFDNNILVIKVTGDGFLRNMVRMLIGAFLDYNEEKTNTLAIKNLLEQPKKGAAIRKAPGCGLYLYDIEY